MANTFVDTVKVVGDKMLQFLEPDYGIIGDVDRQLESSFEMSKESYGQSVNVPKPPRYVSQAGPVISNVSTINIETIPVTVDKWRNVTVSLSALDRNFNAKEFDAWAEKYLKPMVSPLKSDVATDIFGLYKKVANYVGTPGTGFGTTAQTALDLMGAAREMLTYQNTPENRVCYLNPTGSRKFVAALGLNYNPMSDIGAMIKDGKPFRTEGFVMKEAVQVAQQTCGTFAPAGSVLTNGTDQVGNAIALNTGTNAATILVGDVLSFAGVYEVNPVTGKSTGTLKRFVVTANAVMSGNACTVYVSPSVIPTGAFKNITGANADLAGIPDDAIVYMNNQLATGTARTDAQQMAFWTKALGLVCVPIRAPQGLKPITRSINGVSITLTIGADIFQYAEYFRADLAYGVVAYYPENCVRITN